MAHAETYLLPTGAPINHPWGFGARIWADLVVERTDGRIVFDVVPDAVAAGVGGELEFSALSRGVIDLAGISLRVPEVGPVRQAFTMLGVDAIAASPRQALLQMRLGMIDGSVGRLADMNAEPDLPEAYDTWTRWPCVAEPLIFAVNRDLWARWSTEDRVIVGQAALEAAIAQAEAARILARNQGAVLEWDDVVFVDVTRSHAMKLAQELEPVFYEWSGDVGTDLVRDAQAVLDARSP